MKTASPGITARLAALVGPGPSEQARWFAPLSAASAIALSVALQVSNGMLKAQGILWLTIAFLLLVAAVVLPRRVSWSRFDLPLVRVIAGAGVLTQLGLLYWSQPGLDMQVTQSTLAQFSLGIVALGVFSAALLFTVRRSLTQLAISGLVIVHFALGAWMIRNTPDVPIDVAVFHHNAISALWHGRDPYGTFLFPDLYQVPGRYGPGFSVGGMLTFGFPYPPLSLLVAMPGQILAHDHRYAQLFAIEVAAVLMAFSQRRGCGPAAAALFLTLPRIFFVLQQSWTEPFLVMGLAAVVFAACQSSRAVPWLFGAFLALKQYLVLAVPAGLLLACVGGRLRDPRRLFGIAALVVAGTMLPFVIWNPLGFWRSVVTLQFYQPFRDDSLSYLAFWVLNGHERASSIVSFVAAGVASVLSLAALPRTAGGFAASVALTFLAFFAFNKQAFCNYYFFVAGALLIALSAWSSAGSARPQQHAA